jgi:hypothetical protein
MGNENSGKMEDQYSTMAMEFKVGGQQDVTDLKEYEHVYDEIEATLDNNSETFTEKRAFFNNMEKLSLKMIFEQKTVQVRMVMGRLGVQKGRIGA